MSNTKISDLTELVSVQTSDVLPIVDTLNDQTKKVTVGNVVATGLSAGAITTAKIADNAVTTAKIADDAVTAAKLANTSVTAGSYTLSSVTVDAQGRITAASSGTSADTDKIDWGEDKCAEEELENLYRRGVLICVGKGKFVKKAEDVDPEKGRFLLKPKKTLLHGADSDPHDFGLHDPVLLALYSNLYNYVI